MANHNEYELNNTWLGYFISQYLVAKPRARSNAYVLFGMFSTRHLHCSGIIIFHSSTTNLLSSCVFLDLRSEAAALMMRHIVSIGLMFGDCAGQSRSWTPCSFIQVLLALAVWHRALSCWKIQCWTGRWLKRARADGSMWCSKIWQYVGEFIVPLQTVSCPTPPALMHPQTIMLPPPRFPVASVQAGTCSFPRLLRTLTCGRVGYSWKLDSSDHRIFAQCTCVHWRCSSPHRRLDLCFSFINVFLQYMTWNHVSKVAHEPFWLSTGLLTGPTTVASVLELFSSCRFHTGEAEHGRLLLYSTWAVHSQVYHSGYPTAGNL